MKPTRSLLRSTCSLAFTLGALFALAPGAWAACPEIRVVSYNIHHGAPDGFANCHPDRCSEFITDIGDLLASVDADVIGLQEVDRLTERASPPDCHVDDDIDCIDQSAFLGQYLGMSACFGGNISLQGGDFGNAILSRMQILECSNTLLPCEMENGACVGEQRGILTAQIDVDGTPVTFFNTHFQAGAPAQDRVLQAQAAAAMVDSVDEPVILVGDLNAGPTSGALTPIRNRLQDAWLAAGDPVDPDGWTTPTSRIDYVFFSDSATAHFAQVLRYPKPSDHFLLFADLEVRGPDDVPVAQCRNVSRSASPGTCTADASVDDGSFHPCNDPLVLAQDPTGPYSLGSTNVTLKVTDTFGQQDSCGALVTVTDDTPPSIDAISVTPDVLWPPKHRMIPVRVDVSASDACDGNVECRIIHIANSESDEGKGDGSFAGDTAITGELTANLRAERSGLGDGRTYTLTVKCEDDSQNSATASSTVAVPRSQGGP